MKARTSGESEGASGPKSAPEGHSPEGAGNRWLHWLTGRLAMAGSVMIATLAMLVVIDITLRNVFGYYLVGPSEIGAFLLTAIAFMQLPDAALNNRLTQVEWLGSILERRKPRFAKAHQAVLLISGAAICALIAYAAFPGLVSALNSGEFSGSEGHFTMPTWPVRLIIVVGSALAALAFVVRAFHLPFKNLDRG